MGIVVSVFMLLGLLMVSPLTWLSLGPKRQDHRLANFIGVGLLLAGLWNFCWHGLRFLNEFWGLAALVSGLFMLMVAVIILHRFANSAFANHPIVNSVYKLISPLAFIWVMGLLFSFALYAVTLIRLNLGLPIIF
ncbi:MAG: hypothetical protein ACI9NY_001637 [Kiritimatiellia bacterium]|jgi:hypothetical protein